jgi:hypothetical protein
MKEQYEGYQPFFLNNLIYKCIIPSLSYEKNQDGTTPLVRILLTIKKTF